MKSCEQMINLIRNRLFEVISDLARHDLMIGESETRKVGPVVYKLEEVVIDFERLVNQIPEDARSSRPLKTEWLGFEKTFP